MRWGEEYRYILYGLVVSSWIECPQLCGYDGTRDVDVRIERGTVPELTGPGKLHGVKFEAVGDTLLIKTNRMRILVSGGDCILIQPFNGTSDDDIRMLLLGWGMGALLHQRALLPLHACAVAAPEGPSIALCGESGTGKSTLAAAFIRRGYRLLDDNTSAIEVRGEKPHVLPGCPELKLFGDMIDIWPADWTRGVSSQPCGDKTGLHMHSHFEACPRLLGAVFILSVFRSTGTTLRRIRGGEAFHQLNRQIFCHRFLVGMGMPGRHFQTLLRIADSVPVFAFELPTPRQHPDALAEIVEQSLAQNHFHATVQFAPKGETR